MQPTNQAAQERLQRKQSMTIQNKHAIAGKIIIKANNNITKEI